MADNSDRLACIKAVRRPRVIKDMERARAQRAGTHTNQATAQRDIDAAPESGNDFTPAVVLKHRMSKETDLGNALCYSP